jgi:hypothetical protein
MLVADAEVLAEEAGEEDEHLRIGVGDADGVTLLVAFGPEEHAAGGVGAVSSACQCAALFPVALPVGAGSRRSARTARAQTFW